MSWDITSPNPEESWPIGPGSPGAMSPAFESRRNFEDNSAYVAESKTEDLNQAWRVAQDEQRGEEREEKVRERDIQGRERERQSHLTWEAQIKGPVVAQGVSCHLGPKPQCLLLCDVQ